LCLISGLSWAAEHQDIHLIYLGDSDGEFIPLQCDSGKTPEANWSNLLAELQPVRREETLVLSPGNVLGTEPSGLILLEQGAPGVAVLGDLVRRTGASLVVPSLEEFSLPARRFLSFVQEYQEAGVPYFVANIKCADTDTLAGQECARIALPQGRILRVGDVRLGLIPLVSPRVGALVPPANVAGVEFLDPLETTKKLVTAWKEAAAVDLVIVLASLEEGPGQSGKTMEFARDVEGVHVIIAGGMADPQGVESVVTFARIRADGPLLFGSPRSPARFGSLTLSLQRGPDGWGIASHSLERGVVTTAHKDPEAQNALARVVAEYCALASRVLGNGTVDPPMNRKEFLGYVLEILRRTSRSHLSILSLDSTRLTEDYVLTGKVTAGTLSNAFERHHVVVVTALGKDLDAFLKGIVAQGGRGLLMAGVEPQADGSVLLNGRPIGPNSIYRMATSGFLASGARGIMSGLVAAPWTRVQPTGFFLQEMVQRYFVKTLRRPDAAEHAISTEKDFRSLWELPLWETGLQLNMGLNNTAIGNPVAYTESQLTRAKFLGFNSDVQFAAQRSTRDHLWNGFSRVQYAMARTAEQDMQETQDRAAQELSYSWTRVRNVWGKGKKYIPVPVVRGRGETEFSRGEGAEYHHLELTGTAGIQWVLGQKVSAGLAYGLRSEVLDPNSDVHYGLQFYYQIVSLPLATWNSVNSMKLDSRFELFYSDWTGDQTVKGQGGSRLSVLLGRGLNFTVGLDMFVYREGTSDVGYSLDTTVGLSWAFDAAHQTF
jgi:hypothetical protein